MQLDNNYSVDTEDDIFSAQELGTPTERPAERTCSLCGEGLSSHQELNLGVCDTCRNDREDLDTDNYLPVDVYMRGREGEYETTLQQPTSLDDVEFDRFSDFPKDDEDYLSRL